MRSPTWILLVGAVLALAPGTASAETAERLTLEQAIERALRRHPGLEEQQARREEARARTELTRASYLPDVSGLFQLTRGTGNVVQGSIFGMRNLPAVSGPPAKRDLDSGTFGTVIGVTASYDLLGLLRRMAWLDAALAAERQAGTATDSRSLDVAVEAARSYLEVVGRLEAVKAARASVDRARTFATIVKPLVDQQLKPGADLSRAQAELALAETQLARVVQSEALARAELARVLGTGGQPLALSVDVLLGSGPTLATATATLVEKHPLVRDADSAIETARAREKATRLEYLPRLELAAALWVRGAYPLPGDSGYGGAQGLVPDVPNWTLGVVVTWPILDLYTTRARTRVVAAEARVATARRRAAVDEVTSQLQAARAYLQGAREVAAKSPVALAAARAAERQATARYRAGLATVLEVAETQRLLLQAEIDDALARLGLWNALLVTARAAGTLEPFLVELRAGSAAAAGGRDPRSP